MYFHLVYWRRCRNCCDFTPQGLGRSFKSLVTMYPESAVNALPTVHTIWGHSRCAQAVLRNSVGGESSTTAHVACLEQQHSLLCNAVVLREHSHRSVCSIPHMFQEALAFREHSQNPKSEYTHCQQVAASLLWALPASDCGIFNAASLHWCQWCLYVDLFRPM